MLPQSSRGGRERRTRFITVATRKRVLVVNAYCDDLGRNTGRRFSVPQALGPTYLAGAFAAEQCNIRLYNEQFSGPLGDAALLAWPDMLVLTGLTVAFDRFRQLAAYAKTKNSKVIVVAGGPAVRALPIRAKSFFDYVCTGDVEQMCQVVRDALGPAYVAEEVFPRFDLTYWFRSIGYLESSRNCNFRCSFCSLTGEGSKYQPYDLEYVHRQMTALGKRRLVIFLDNNFYGNDRKLFLERLAIIKRLWRHGQFRGWTALVTQDFFLKSNNLRLVREAGCLGLFSGIESLDPESLRDFNKRQNTKVSQIKLMRDCLEAGIVFLYGIIFDLAARTINACRAEIELLTGTPGITLPSFITQTIPLLGTPYFRECVDRRLLLPNVKLRDMDGSMLVVKPLDPLGDVTQFLRELPQLYGYRHRVIRHTAGFLRRYGRTMTVEQLAMAIGSAGMILGSTARPWRQRVRASRPFVAGSEPLDAAFRPAFPVDGRYAAYFTPTIVTDEHGDLHADVLADLANMEKNQRIISLEDAGMGEQAALSAGAR